MPYRISKNLRAKLHELARVQGVVPGDLNDEHQRWELYYIAIRDGTGVAELFDLLPMEPETAMASSIVAKMVEQSAPEKRRAWLGQVEEEVGEYARGRVAELEIVDALCSGDFPADQVAESLEGWSNWLQVRVTEYVERPEVLEIMKEHGRTKRVRRQADDALPE